MYKEIQQIEVSLFRTLFSIAYNKKKKYIYIYIFSFISEVNSY
jgi:hypothetical protein